MTRSLGAAVTGASAAILLAACGDGELSAKRGLPANSALVTTSEVVRYKAHSPERTFMAWWRALQYTDSRGYLSLLSTPLRRRRLEDNAHRQQLPVMARQLTPSRPHIKRVEIDGDRATLYAEIEARSLVGADKVSSARYPQAFPMVREGREWRMADDLFVEAGAGPELRRQQQAAAKAGLRQPEVVTVTVPVTPPAPPAGQVPPAGQQP